MLTQVGCKVCEAFIAKHLRRAQYRGRVDVKSLGHLARREKAGLVGGIEDGPDQALASGIKLMLGLRETSLESAGRSVSIAATGLLRGALDLFADLVGRGI